VILMQVIVVVRSNISILPAQLQLFLGTKKGEHFCPPSIVNQPHLL